MVIHDEHAYEQAGGIHAHQDLDGAVVAALEGIEFGGPEREPGEHWRAAPSVFLNTLKWVLTALRRKRRGVGKEPPQLPFQFRVGRGLGGDERRGCHHNRKDPHLLRIIVNPSG